MTLDIVIFGLSITSSWGNGHATTYRALIKALNARGHRVTFLERDVPWYREHRDLADPPYCRTELYETLAEVPARFGQLVAGADVVMLGSYVPDGAAVGDWIGMNARGVTAFYDIDTPVTLAKLAHGKAEYLTPALIPRFDLYLSFTGGPVLDLIERTYGSPRARALYCAVDPDLHSPVDVPLEWSLGYLGTYSDDRQPVLERLLLAPARRLTDQAFVVAGSMYPHDLIWPDNVQRIEHLSPDRHGAFYCAQRFTLNVTRADMIETGYSPSVRLFEAAACGVPIISDRWPGIETFFTPGDEIFLADSSEDVCRILLEVPETRRRDVTLAAHKRALQEHSALRRAEQLEDYIREVRASRRRPRRVEAVA